MKFNRLEFSRVKKDNFFTHYLKLIALRGPGSFAVMRGTQVALNHRELVIKEVQWNSAIVESLVTQKSTNIAGFSAILKVQ